MTSIDAPSEFFAAEALRARGVSLHQRYLEAEPFPHICLDGFFPEELLRRVAAEFPEPDSHWQGFDNRREVKFALADEARFPKTIRDFLRDLNSRAFLGFLEELTGIPKLLPDPYLSGGGMHCIRRGGFLKVHADFNWHEQLGVHRRINVLIYLNEDWDESFGGHLELWRPGGDGAVGRYLPIMGRVIVFSTTSESLHGHPEPLQCPEDRARRSLALYYYTAARPEEELRPAHSTLFVGRPGEKIADTWLQRRGGVKGLLRLFVPPVLTPSGWRRFVGRS